MTTLIRSILTSCLLLAHALAAAQSSPATGGILVTYQDSEDHSFSVDDRARVEAVVAGAEPELRALLPALAARINLTVSPIDRDLAAVGGVTGRADNPEQVVVYISTVYDGGIGGAIDTGLAATLYHEFHHLARGWTMEDNQFGPGITIAAVNEGLANAFSEIYTETAFTGNAYPENVDEWLAEVLDLPVDANYNQWMNQHPDGRLGIGYRVGSYIAYKAMELSGMSVLELSQLTPQEILAIIDRDQLP